MNRKGLVFILAAVLLASILQGTSNAAENKMYWVEEGSEKVRSANLDGSNVRDLVTGLETPYGIALDVSGGKMYWTDRGADKIQCANLDGSNVRDLITELEDPYGIALDVSNSKMYWVDGGADKIQRANLDGTNVKTLVSSGLSDPSALALDVSRGKIYWTDFDAGKIQCANLDGTNVETLISGMEYPDGLALDVSGGKIYWTDFDADKIQCANLDGTNVETLISSGLDRPYGIALDVSGGKMYWTAWNGGKIQRANLNGINVETLISSGLNRPASITLDVSGGKLTDDHSNTHNGATQTSLNSSSSGTIEISGDVDYFRIEVNTSGELTVETTGNLDTVGELRDHTGSRLANNDGGNGSNFRIHRNVSAGTYYVKVEEYGGNDTGTYNLHVRFTVDVITQERNKIYWLELGSEKVRSANLDALNVQELVTRGLDQPFGIALDISSGKMYWTDYGTGKIQRANFDGRNVKTLLSELPHPVGIALDVSSGKMYWIDWKADKIQRADLDGRNVETLVSGLTNPTDIALDVSSGKMYWIEWGGSKIQRADLDGRNVETLVSGLVDVEFIALDVLNGKMYWTDHGAGEIQRADLDGSNVETLISGLDHPAGIALDVSSGKMYWTDHGAGEIQRATLDGSNVETLVSGLDHPTGIALDMSGGTPPPTDTAVTSLPLINAVDLHLTEHTGDIRCVVYSPTGVVLASGSTDNTIRLWRTSTGEHLNTLDKHTGDVNSIAFSPDDRWIASGGDDGIVHFWKWSTSADTWVSFQSFTITGTAITNNVKSVAFNHQSSILACGTTGNKVLIWNYDPDQGKWIYRQALKGHTGPVNSVVFSPWGVMLASASGDNTVRLWHARTGELLATLEKHTAAVNSVDFSRDDTFIATGSDDDTVILWKWSMNADTWAHYRTLEDPNADVRSVVFNPSGTVLLGGIADNTIQVWDGTTGDHQTFLQEHTGAVNSIAYNFQGNAFASGSDDDTVRQLAHTESTDIANRGIGLAVPSDLISDVAFGQNATYFVLNAQFPTLTGVSAADVVYKKCKIQIALPDDTQYFMFPIKTVAERTREAYEDLIQDIGIGSFTAGIGLIPIYGDAVAFTLSTGYSVFKFGETLLEISKSFSYPEIQLTNDAKASGSPNVRYRFLLLIEKPVTSIKLTVGLDYQLKSETRKFWFDPNRTVTYEGTWNLADSTLSAPSAQLMSLKDYPHFQLLPPEVQAYLLQHFGELMSTGAWLIPEETSLLPNYPNPFNPETWIPYQLAEAADVTLTIYDIKGRVVRDLDLGHQRAGMYHARSRAVYWDGRNTHGEPVASGVYFYTLKAGEFAATRKMLIRK